MVRKHTISDDSENIKDKLHTFYIRLIMTNERIDKAARYYKDLGSSIEKISARLDDLAKYLENNLEVNKQPLEKNQDIL
jgi:hypothetical protein